MKKVFCAVLILAVSLGGFVGAQGKAVWHKDKRLVTQWVMSDKANVEKWIDWCAANLTQEQVDNIEVMMFPDLPNDQKSVALELVKLQMQQFSLERSDDVNVKAAIDALDTAITESKAETVSESAATVEPKTATK